NIGQNHSRTWRRARVQDVNGVLESTSHNHPLGRFRNTNQQVVGNRGAAVETIGQGNRVEVPALSAIARGTGDETPAQLNVLIGGRCRQVHYRGDESAGRTAPGLSAFERVARTDVQRREVSVGDERAPSRNNVNERGAIGGNLQNPTVGAIIVNVKPVAE